MKLTRRELDVLRLVARGHTNKQIAAELGIEVVSVKSLNTELFKKLGVENRTAAALAFLERTPT